MDRHVLLVDAATAIADGDPVDWGPLDAALSGSADSDAMAGLHLLERIVSFHSSLPSTSTSSTAASFGGPPLGSVFVPTTWGPLTIVERVGRGTFGDVYRARDPRLDRPVALKLLRRRDERDTDTTVVEEARLHARVRHPNVVTVYGAERIDGRVGIWMELVDGATLEDELRRRGPFPPDEVARIGTELCGALGSVHRAGLLHRDLKAQNVMRDAEGRVMLADFGAGRELIADGDGPAASGRELAGTPLYLAPEVLEGSPASTKSDIYSLGVLLHHLVTARFPVHGRSIRALRDAHGRGLRDPLTRSGSVPRGLARAIDRATDPDPSNRYADAASFQAALFSTLDSPGAFTRRAAAVVLIAAAVAVVGWAMRARVAPENPGDRGGGILVREIRPDWARAVALAAPFPDGRSAACTDIQTGDPAICDFSTGAVRVLPVSGSSPQQPARPVLVSPDARRLAYAMVDGSGQQVHEISVDGTGDRLIFRTSPHDRFVRLLGYSSSGDSLALAVATSQGTQQWGLVTLDGAAPRWFKEFPEPAPDSLVLSPDGRYLAFDMLPTPGSPARDIRIFDIASGAEWPLFEHPANDLSPVWTSDGSQIVFSSDRLGTMGLWSIPVRDGRPTGDAILIRDMGRTALMPHGFTSNGSLMFTMQTGWFDVYVAPIDVPSATVGPPERIASRLLDQNTTPDWSPDGTRLAFASGTGSRMPGSNRIVIKNVRTGAEAAFPHDTPPQQTRLRWTPDGHGLFVNGALLDAETGARTPLPQRMGAFEWSHDGRTAYAAFGNSIVSLDATSGKPTELHRESSGADVYGIAISPDERWLAFTTLRDGLCAIHLLPIDGGGGPTERLRLTEGCAEPAWTSDGQWILYSAGSFDDERRMFTLWAAPAFGGDPHRLPLTMEQIWQIRTSPDGRHVAFTAGFPHQERWIMEGLAAANR